MAERAAVNRQVVGSSPTWPVEGQVQKREASPEYRK